VLGIFPAAVLIEGGDNLTDQMALRIGTRRLGDRMKLDPCLGKLPAIELELIAIPLGDRGSRSKAVTIDLRIWYNYN
jgi:hypothetical protein